MRVSEIPGRSTSSGHLGADNLENWGRGGGSRRGGVRTKRSSSDIRSKSISYHINNYQSFFFVFFSDSFVTFRKTYNLGNKD